jgi:hypothetical protein
VQADANRLRAQLEERAESLNAAKKALAEIESKVHRATLATAKLKVICSFYKLLNFCTDFVFFTFIPINPEL